MSTVLTRLRLNSFLGPLIIYTAIFVVTICIHRFGPIKGAYSFFQPLTIFKDSVMMNGRPVIIFAACLLGLVSGKARLLWPAWKIFLGGTLIGTLFIGYFGIDRLYDAYSMGLLIATILAIREKKSSLLSAIRITFETCIGFCVISYFFTLLKGYVFYFSPPHDLLVQHIEVFLFGGNPHLYFTSIVKGDVKLAQLLDSTYLAIFLHMSSVFVYLIGRGDLKATIHFGRTLQWTYVIGGLLYFAIPALGPLFVDPVLYDFIHKQGLKLSFVGDMIWNKTSSVMAGNLDLKTITPYGFVASVPSLHMAHEFILLYFSKGEFIMFFASSLFLLLTMVGVMGLGLHYFIDIPLGLILGGSCIWLARSRSKRENYD